MWQVLSNRRSRRICWVRTPDTHSTRLQLKEEERGGGGVISRLTGSLQSWMMNFIQAHGFGGILLLVRSEDQLAHTLSCARNVMLRCIWNTPTSHMQMSCLCLRCRQHGRMQPSTSAASAVGTSRCRSGSSLGPPSSAKHSSRWALQLDTEGS